MKYSVPITCLLFSLLCQYAAADRHEAGEPVTGVIQREPAPVVETAPNTDASQYQCRLNGLSRRVAIEYPEAPQSLPCEVTYYKDSEAPETPQVLWRANNDESYCKQQLDFMVNRLKGWGWQCE